MIPNVTRGSDMYGAVQYMVEVRDAENTRSKVRAMHVDPHLVAGSPSIVAEYEGTVLSVSDVADIASLLDEPRMLFETYVKGGHVWDVSLAAAPEDGELTDEKWGKIAVEFMREMGYVDAEGHRDVPFVAIRHGRSGEHGNGQDHIHIASSLVREDGTKADTWKDYARSQNACRELERRHGLRELSDGFGARSDTLAERKAAKVRGLEEPERVTLARHVRDAAAMSKTEAEFVLGLRRRGVEVLPRWAKDGARVTGYRVSLDPPAGHERVPYSGSKLAHDLGLGVLRNGWHEDVESRREAHREWTLADEGAPLEHPADAPVPVFQSVLIDKGIGELERLRVKFENTPVTDHEEKRRTAAHLSGLWASWSRVMEPPEGGPMRRVSDSLARAAQVSRHAYRKGERRPNPTPVMVEVMDAFERGHRYGAMQLFREMAQLTGAVRDYLRARNDRVKADDLSRVAAEDLRAISADLRELSAQFGALPPEQQTLEAVQSGASSGESQEVAETVEQRQVREQEERALRARRARTRATERGRGRGLGM